MAYFHYLVQRQKLCNIKTLYDAIKTSCLGHILLKMDGIFWMFVNNFVMFHLEKSTKADQSYEVNFKPLTVIEMQAKTTSSKLNSF